MAVLALTYFHITKSLYVMLDVFWNLAKYIVTHIISVAFDVLLDITLNR